MCVAVCVRVFDSLHSRLCVLFHRSFLSVFCSGFSFNFTCPSRFIYLPPPSPLGHCSSRVPLSVRARSRLFVSRPPDLIFRPVCSRRCCSLRPCFPLLSPTPSLPAAGLLASRPTASPSAVIYRRPLNNHLGGSSFCCSRAGTTVCPAGQAPNDKLRMWTTKKMVPIATSGEDQPLK